LAVVGWFFAITVLAGFVLNEIWEMTQMSADVETAGRSWTSTLGLCTRAAVGDVGIVLGIYAAGALASGRWSYTERMPVVSMLGAGLWPLLQMTLLPPLTFLFARWWAGRSATEGAL
jgi:hypothetical protein